MAPAPVKDHHMAGSFVLLLPVLLIHSTDPLHFVAVPSECLLLCKSRNHTLEVSFRKRKGMVLRALKVGFSVRHNR